MLESMKKTARRARNKTRFNAVRALKASGSAAVVNVGAPPSAHPSPNAIPPRNLAPIFSDAMPGPSFGPDKCHGLLTRPHHQQTLTNLAHMLVTSLAQTSLAKFQLHQLRAAPVGVCRKNAICKVERPPPTPADKLSAMLRTESNWSSGSYVAHELCNSSQYAKHRCDR
jgi:hypothetical protein